MKISASIYSDKKRPLKEVVEDLVQHQVDMLHVDCNDDPTVFNDIRHIREWTDIPIDLHIITKDPRRYYDLLIEVPVEYVTFQYEPLNHVLDIPDNITGRKGIAIVTPTSIDVFDQYSNLDFILIMATTPGQSGGVFDKINFSKIRQFRRKYPSKSIHVDGGVNGEVSFILRNMGVSSAVSGSYLFSGPSVGHALMNLTKRNIESHFRIADFMMPLEECPKVQQNDLSLKSVLETIENGNMGFCLVVANNGNLQGIVASADVRKAMLRKLENLGEIKPEDLLNTQPVCIDENATVLDMLRKIKSCNFSIMYLPVVKNGVQASGIVNFVHLVKGEL